MYTFDIKIKNFEDCELVDQIVFKYQGISFELEPIWYQYDENENSVSLSERTSIKLCKEKETCILIIEFLFTDLAGGNVTKIDITKKMYDDIKRK